MRKFRAAFEVEYRFQLSGYREPRLVGTIGAKGRHECDFKITGQNGERRLRGLCLGGGRAGRFDPLRRSQNHRTRDFS